MRVVASELRRATGLCLAAGVLGAGVTALIELLFRASAKEILSFAGQMALCAFVGAATVAIPFARLSTGKLPAALLLATCGLGVTYLLFGVVTALRDFASHSPNSPLSAFAAIPLFAAFSLPITLPTALVFAWLAHRFLMARTGYARVTPRTRVQGADDPE